MNKNYPKELFTLIHEKDKKIFDKELKTKQLSYFQDAMLRFGRNKYNVIASFILLFLIVMSIIVPILTPKDLYTKTNSDLRLLPPRVPVLENYGILDGTKFVKNESVNPNTINPVTGLGYPTVNYNPEFIDFSTLENETQVGTYLDPSFLGGTAELRIGTNREAFTIVTKELVSIGMGQGLFLDIDSMDTGKVEVYLIKGVATEEDVQVDIETEEQFTVIVMSTKVGDIDVEWGDTRYMTYLGEVTGDDIQKIEVPASGYGLLAFRYVVDGPSDGNDLLSLNSIYTTSGEPDGEKIKYYEGFELANFSLVSLDPDTENGSYNRNGATRLVASFVYDSYSALFDDKLRLMKGSEYQKIIAENPGMEATKLVSTVDDKSWTFDDQYPIKQVLTYYESAQDTNGDGVISDDETYFTYEVLVDGKYALEFDSVPYFLFGTDVGGKDLFSLIWLGLRTSLLLGFLAAATNIFIGIIWGSISGYYGGQVDILMERFTDVWGSFPQITMISIISIWIGPGFFALYVFMIYAGWIGASRITRMQFYRYKGREYVLAARTLGASDARIIFKHILPNALGTIVTRVILSIPAVIFLEVNLSYLGFGIGNGQKLKFGPVELTGTSIGVILNDGQTQILAGNLWLIIYPTIIVSILMITFNMFGNALRDALNPQLRGSN